MSTARAYAPVSSPGLTWANPATGGAPQRVTERLRLATGVDDLQPPDRAHRPVLLRRPARRPVPRCEHLPGGRRRPPGHPPRGNRHEHRHPGRPRPWPGSWPGCCAAGPRQRCWTLTRPSFAPPPSTTSSAPRTHRRRPRRRGGTARRSRSPHPPPFEGLKGLPRSARTDGTPRRDRGRPEPTVILLARPHCRSTVAPQRPGRP